MKYRGTVSGSIYNRNGQYIDSFEVKNEGGILLRKLFAYAVAGRNITELIPDSICVYQNTDMMINKEDIPISNLTVKSYTVNGTDTYAATLEFAIAADNLTTIIPINQMTVKLFPANSSVLEYLAAVSFSSVSSELELTSGMQINMQWKLELEID